MDECPKCFFLDVGQGNSSVVLFPDDSAIVFDAGPQSQGVVWNSLDALNVKKIHCVVLSHNDRDHIEGFAKIAETYGRKIRAIYALKDRLVKNKGFEVILALAGQGIIPRPIRAEVRDMSRPLTIFRKGTLSVQLLYPDFLANEQAVREKLTTEICVIPHHGGFIGERVDCIEWLLNKAIRAKYAVISVGINNTYEHPREDVMAVLRNQGMVVLCTEITPKCDLRLEAINPGVLDKLVPYSRSVMTEEANHVACAGTIVASFEETYTKVQRLRAHRKSIGTKVNNPLCIRRLDSNR